MIILQPYPILNSNRNINYSLQQASDKTGIEVDGLKWQAVATSFAHSNDSDDSEEP